MVYMGFDQYVNADSRLLILGSFPSVKSREEGFYYGNKQNRFWKILAECFAAPLPLTVPEKQTLLQKHRIALWDIVTACEIIGSMDKDIRHPQIADIPALLSQAPIARIITNGGTAHTLLLRHFPQLADLCTPLPSTSPANARPVAAIWLQTLRAFTE